MDGNGFHVDIGVLESAAKAMGEISDKQDRSELADVCDEADEQTVGSDTMYDALVSFCETTSEGIDYLVDKAEDTREGLSEVAQNYREVERAAIADLRGDPAAEAADDTF